jgi:NAD(P)-dependent dehydrogenase (short-subunit alcohol dehydrogenase family)
MRPAATYPDLAGKGALVTGGADGIGQAIVEVLARQKARVAFLDLDQPRGEALAALLTEEGATVSFHPVDLRDITATQNAIAAARTACGPFAIGINNAGHDERHAFGEVTPDYWDDRFAVNLRPMMFVAKSLAADMKALGSGSLINLSSTSWMKGSPGMIAYTTAKAAVLGFTKSLARELGPDNIRVNCLTPGWVMTERQIQKWLTPEGELDIQRNQVLPDKVRPEDVAPLALFLASDDARACSAQEYIVDAGWL